MHLRLADAPEDFKALRLEKADLSQAWTGDRQIRLRIYRESAGDAFSYLLLTIDARPISEDNDEESYRGTYELTLYGSASGSSESSSRVFRGAVQCSLE